MKLITALLALIAAPAAAFVSKSGEFLRHSQSWEGAPPRGGDADCTACRRNGASLMTSRAALAVQSFDMFNPVLSTHAPGTKGGLFCICVESRNLT